MRRSLPLVLATTFLACTSGGTPTEAQRMQASQAAAATLSLQHALVVTDALVAYDPTLDGGRDATMNAMAVDMQATTSLGGCGTVTQTGAMIAVDFGAAPGCMLPSGVQVSGVVSVALSISMGVHADLTFTHVIVDGKHLDGTLGLVLRLDTGTSLAVTGNLTTDEGTLAGTGTLVPTTGAFTLDGMLTQTPTGGTAQTFAVTGLHLVQNACYADAGSVGITSAGVTTRLTFDASTPSTGVVMTSIGPLAFTTTLPAYGTCPHP